MALDWLSLVTLASKSRQDQNQTQEKLEINTSPNLRTPTVTALSRKARALRFKGIQGRFCLNRRYTALLLMIQFQSPLGGQSSTYLSGQPTQFSYHVFVSLTSIELQIRDPFNIIPFNQLQNFQLRMAHHVKLGFHSEPSVAKVVHAQECACIVVLNESVHGTKSFPRAFVKP